MTSEECRNSYTEVLTIIDNLPITDYEKIPKELVSYFKENCNLNYSFEYDYSKKLSEQNIQILTKGIISTIYKYYLANEEENKRILELEKFQIVIEDKAKKEKYNFDNIFKNDTRETLKFIDKNNNEDSRLIEYKSNIFVKLKNIILKIFHI